MLRLVCACVLVLAAAPAAAAPLPQVAYAVDEAAASWQPLDPVDVARTVEHAALEVLSKPGLIQLNRTRARALPRQGADFALLIEGRMIEEAETHTVYLTFQPGARADLPSLRASASAALGKKSRAQMASLIDASARQAAGALLALLEPHLRGLGGPAAAPADALEKPALPWRWPEVHVPRPSGLRAAAGLGARDEQVRRAALRELTSLALTESSPRHALESCALGHPDARLRLGCLQALRPLSRRLAPTQRVVNAVFRRDHDRAVVAEASEQMTYFTGLARKDAIQAWLERAANGEVLGPLDKLGDLPNLDLAIRQCLLAAGQRPKHERSKRACIELLEPVSHERRRRILRRHLEEVAPDSPFYLEGAGPREGSMGTDWQWAVEAALEDAARWDPELSEILWRRYQRSLSSFALQVLAEKAEPTPRLADRMLEALQTGGGRAALAGLRRIGHERPELAPTVRERVARLVHTGEYPKTLRARDLEELVRDLEKAK